MADGDDIAAIVGAAEEAVTYPILTREVTGSGRGTSGGNGNGAAAGGSLTNTAQGAIRDLLGWRYRADDPKGFLAALNKAVNLKEVEGHIQYEWQTRPFMVQADMGEVTGAQASIYKRARVAVDHALPLLDSLKPLRSDPDAEHTESVRALVRSALNEIVSELALVSGPRIQRVNEYFRRLLGIEMHPLDKRRLRRVAADPSKVRGTLRELRKRFGLDQGLVLTVDEERNYTNFLILVDYTSSLAQTWVAQRGFIERDDKPNKFLGTQLVRLSQGLNVIVGSVHDAYDAMDSVFFGPDEREVTEIIVPGQPRITVAQLLGWVERFASVEAKQLIEDSGKDGVNAIASTLRELRHLMHCATKQSEQP
jgi:predicted transcriptional regulator with HTH domain